MTGDEFSYLKREAVLCRNGIKKEFEYLQLAFYAKAAEVGDKKEKQAAIDDFYQLLLSIDENKRKDIILKAFMNSGVHHIFDVLKQLEDREPHIISDINNIAKINRRNIEFKLPDEQCVKYRRDIDELHSFRHVDKKESPRQAALVVIGQDDKLGKEGELSGNRRVETLFKQGYDVYVVDARFQPRIDIHKSPVYLKAISVLSWKEIRLDEAEVYIHGAQDGALVEKDKSKLTTWQRFKYETSTQDFVKYLKKLMKDEDSAISLYVDYQEATLERLTKSGNEEYENVAVMPIASAIEYEHKAGKLENFRDSLANQNTEGNADNFQSSVSRNQKHDRKKDFNKNMYFSKSAIKKYVIKHIDFAKKEISLDEGFLLEIYNAHESLKEKSKINNESAFTTLADVLNELEVKDYTINVFRDKNISFSDFYRQQKEDRERFGAFSKNFIDELTKLCPKFKISTKYFSDIRKYQDNISNITTANNIVQDIDGVEKYKHKSAFRARDIIFLYNYQSGLSNELCK